MVIQPLPEISRHGKHNTFWDNPSPNDRCQCWNILPRTESKCAFCNFYQLFQIVLHGTTEENLPPSSILTKKISQLPQSLLCCTLIPLVPPSFLPRTNPYPPRWADYQHPKSVISRTEPSNKVMKSVLIQQNYCVHTLEFYSCDIKL